MAGGNKKNKGSDTKLKELRSKIPTATIPYIRSYIKELTELSKNNSKETKELLKAAQNRLQSLLMKRKPQKQSTLLKLKSNSKPNTNTVPLEKRYTFVALLDMYPQFYYSSDVAMLLLEFMLPSTVTLRSIDLSVPTDTTDMCKWMEEYDSKNDIAVVVRFEDKSYGALYIRHKEGNRQRNAILFKHPSYDKKGTHGLAIVMNRCGAKRSTAFRHEDWTKANSMANDDDNTLQYVVHYLYTMSDRSKTNDDVSNMDTNGLIKIRSNHADVFQRMGIVDDRTLEQYLEKHKGVVFDKNHTSNNLTEDDLRVGDRNTDWYDIYVLKVILYIKLKRAGIHSQTRIVEVPTSSTYRTYNLYHVNKYLKDHDICVVVNKNNNHFCSLFIAKGTNVPLYNDPYGSSTGIPARVLEECSLANLDDVVDEKIQVQRPDDTINCGPLTVELLFKHCTNELNESNKGQTMNWDPNVIRKEHQRILFDYMKTEYPNKHMMMALNDEVMTEIANMTIESEDNPVRKKKRVSFIDLSVQSETERNIRKPKRTSTTWTYDRDIVEYRPYVYKNYTNDTPYRNDPTDSKSNMRDKDRIVLARWYTNDADEAYVRCTSDRLITDIRKKIFRRISSARSTQRYREHCVYDDTDFYRWIVFRNEQLYVLRDDHVRKECVKGPVTRKAYVYVPISKEQCHGLTRYIYERKHIEPSSEQKGISDPSFTIDNDKIAFW